MDKLIIEGGVPLSGEIRVSGSKNAALPILFAAIAVTGETVFSNVPRLRDIHTTLKLLEILGCEYSFEDDVARVRPGRLKDEAPYELVKTMRASVLCLGPLLARLGVGKVALPGGCAIGARPVDMHLTALEKMGAVFELDGGYIEGRCADGLTGAHIQFPFPTVGGTENLLMAAALAEGTTVLENAAREPEVCDLANFLIACGAKISGHGTSVVTIEGVPELTAVDYAIMPDRIEAGTYLAAAGITGGELTLTGCPVHELAAVNDVLTAMGMDIRELGEHCVGVSGEGRLRAVDVRTMPYPGFPTDMQAQTMALMTLAEGTGVIEETIFENRYMHVQELVRMGANIKLSGRTATVRGVSHLSGAPVMASDLRASASLVLAGLAARGTTEVQRIYHLDRGYEQIEDKLNGAGARVTRAKE